MANLSNWKCLLLVRSSNLEQWRRKLARILSIAEQSPVRKPTQSTFTEAQKNVYSEWKKRFHLRWIEENERKKNQVNEHIFFSGASLKTITASSVLNAVEHATFHEFTQYKVEIYWYARGACKWDSHTCAYAMRLELLFNTIASLYGNTQRRACTAMYYTHAKAERDKWMQVLTRFTLILDGLPSLSHWREHRQICHILHWHESYIKHAIRFGYQPIVS